MLITSRVSVLALVAGLATACGSAGPPDYEDAAAIAVALNAAGIDCTFTDTTTIQPSTAVLGGRCDGEEVALTMFVFGSAGDREEAERYNAQFVCDLGIDNPKQVRGDRWIVGTAEPIRGSSTVYAEDLAAATGGELVPVCRD